MAREHPAAHGVGWAVLFVRSIGRSTQSVTSAAVQPFTDPLNARGTPTGVWREMREGTREIWREKPRRAARGAPGSNGDEDA